MRKKRIVFLTVGLLFFGYFLYLIIHSILQGFSTLNETISVVHELDSRDSLLFKPNIIRNIKVDEVRISKVRSPLLLLTYKDSFDIIAHRIPVSNLFRVEKDINVRVERHVRTAAVTYNTINKNSFKLSYKGGKLDTVKNVRVLLDGGSYERLEVTDHEYFFVFTGKRMSIKFSGEVPLNIVLEGAETISGMQELQLQVLFASYNGEIVLFMMLPKTNSHNSNLILKEIVSAPGESNPT